MTIRTIWVNGEVPYTKNFGTLAELLALVPSTEFAEGFASDHGRIDWVKGAGWMSGGKLLSPDGTIAMSGPLRVDRGVSTARGARLRAHLSRRVRISSFDYSIANFYSGSSFAIESILATIPGGATPSQPTFQGTKCAIMARTKKVHLVGNCGISGETTTQMLARSAATASASRKAIQDCLSTRPDLIFLTGPLVNDAQMWTEASTTADADAAVVRAKAIIESLAANCPHVAFVGCMGINPSGWTSARKEYVQGLTAYAVAQLESWAAGSERRHFLNPEGRLSVRQSWISGYSDDGIHPNNKGGGVWADMLEELVDDLWDVTLTDPILYDYNKDWATVVSGKPTGVTVTATGTTSSVVNTTANGVMEVAFTTADVDDGIYITTTTVETAIAPLLTGEKAFWEFDLELLKSDRTPTTEWQIDNFVRFYNAANEAGSSFPTMSNNVMSRSRIGFCTPVMALDRDASTLGTSCDSRTTVIPRSAGSWILRVFAPQVRKYTTSLTA